ncbi:MAG TPA: tetratricopeptide repeat protein [bacterium]|nr:tetratricopeptide repeat protein [bacterium]
MTPFEKAEHLRARSRFREAEKVYRQILRREKPGPAHRAEALLGLADVERIQGDFRASLSHYRAAEALLMGSDPDAAMDAKVGWALAARAMGRPKEALAVLQKALRFYRKDRDPAGLAFTHWALGGTLRIAGRMKEGLRELDQALALFKRLRDLDGVAYTCCALGGLHRMLGGYAASGKYYREANRRMRALDDVFGTAYSYCGLGNVERMAGRFRSALPYYCKAERLYGLIGDKVSYAYTLWSIGTAYKMLGRHYPEAHWAFYKADRLFQKTGDTRGRTYALLGFAESEWLQGHQAKGDAYWKRAKKIADQSDFAWEALHVESLRGGKVRDLSKRYRNAGSKFYPKTLPVNWP